MQCLDLVEAPLEGSDAVRDLEQAARLLVAGELVLRERLLASADDGPRQELGVAQGIGDAVGRDRVAKETGVADQGPPRAPGATEETGPAGEGEELADAPRRLDRAREIERCVAQELTVERLETACHSAAKVSSGQGREDAGAPVVRGDDADAHAGPVVPVEPARFEPLEVAIDHGRRMPAGVLVVGRDQARDARAQAVGADHAIGMDGKRGGLTRAQRRAAHAPRPVSNEIDGIQAVDDLGARVARRIAQQSIEERTARCVEGVDAIPGLDDDLDRLAVVMEVRRVNRRSTCGLHVAEHAPAVKLEHAAPHQRVGRERVAARPIPIDREHLQPGAREQHGRRSSGAAGADDDRIVVGSHELSPFRPLDTDRRLAGGRCGSQREPRPRRRRR